MCPTDIVKHLIHFILLFTQHKIAVARKSSTAVGKGEGCSCEGSSIHNKYLTLNDRFIIHGLYANCNRQFTQYFRTTKRKSDIPPTNDDDFIKTGEKT